MTEYRATHKRYYEKHHKEPEYIKKRRKYQSTYYQRHKKERLEYLRKWRERKKTPPTRPSDT